MKTKGFSLSKKLTALGLALCLGVSNGPEPVFARNPPVSPLETSADAGAGIFKSLHIPSHLGTVEETYLPGAAAEKTRGVILVQDAHAIPDAQESIRGLIEYFQQEHGLRVAGMEGTEGELDGLLFQAFPDTRLLEEVLGEFTRRGEIPGVILACAFSKTSSLRYYGLEDMALYEQDINAYLQTLEQRETLKAALRPSLEEIESLKKDLYPPVLLTFDSLMEKFHNQDSFEAFLQDLRAFLTGNRLEIKKESYPRLGALLESLADLKPEKKTYLNGEISAAAVRLERALSTYEERQEFYGRRQAYQTEQSAPEEFLEYLLELNSKKRLDLKISEHLQKHYQRYLYVRGMAGEELFRELLAFSSGLKTSLFPSPEAVRLDELGRRAKLIHKTLHLELSKAEWLEVQALTAGSQSVSPSIEPAVRPVSPAARLDVTETRLRDLFAGIREGAFLEFYEVAERREQALLENLLRVMDRNDAKLGLAVAGGFHREGLGRLLKQAGIPYVVVTPRIHSFPEENLYQNQMRGEVSWKSYFEPRHGRIDVYEAFTQAAVDRLMQGYEQESTEAGRLYALRMWRDSLLRTLAGQKRLSGAGRYTRFLDEVLLNRMDPEKRDAFFHAWNRKVDGFVRGLEHLADQNRLTPDAVSNLLKPQTAAAWSPSMIFSPGRQAPSSWILPPSAGPSSQAPVRSAVSETDTGKEEEKDLKADEGEKQTEQVPASRTPFKINSALPIAAGPSALPLVLGLEEAGRRFELFRQASRTRAELREAETREALAALDRKLEEMITAPAGHAGLERAPAFDAKAIETARLIISAAAKEAALLRRMMSVPEQELGHYRLASVKPVGAAAEHADMTALTWRSGEKKALIVFGHHPFQRRTRGFAAIDPSFFGIAADENHYYLINDAASNLSYLRRGDQLAREGLFVSPETGQHVFWIEDITTNRSGDPAAWRQALKMVWKSLAGRPVNRGFFMGADKKEGLNAYYRQTLDTQFETRETGTRYIRLELTADGEVKIRSSREDKKPMKEPKGDFFLLNGEPGARAALALGILLNGKSEALIQELQPFESDTARFLERLFEVKEEMSRALKDSEDVKITPLPILEPDSGNLAVAVTGRKEQGGEIRFVIVLNLSQDPSNRKKFVRVELPESWMSKDQRTVHELTDYSPRIFGFSGTESQYTRIGNILRIGLAPYYSQANSPDNTWMHVFQVESHAVPPLNVYVNRAATQQAAVQPGGFLPPPQFVPKEMTLHPFDQPVEFKASVIVNNEFGQPARLSIEDAGRLIAAEVRHNLAYDEMRVAAAQIVPGESDPQNARYVFRAVLPSPGIPGMFWGNMVFRIRGDTAHEKTYSLSETHRAAIVIDVPEDYRRFPTEPGRREIASSEMTALGLEKEGSLNSLLVSKAEDALTFALKDTMRTGEQMAASGSGEGLYLYTWIRDAVQAALYYTKASDPRIRGIAKSFFGFIWNGFETTGSLSDQRWRFVNGKVLRPVTSFNDPQTDGPAHLGRFALEYLRSGLHEGDTDEVEKAKKILNASVSAVLENARNAYLFLTLGSFPAGKDPRGFDIWEELYGLHFANLLVNYSFLKSVVLAAQEDPALIPDAVKNKLEKNLLGNMTPLQLLEDILVNQFKMKAEGGFFVKHFVAHRKVANAAKMESEKHDARLDSQLIWAMLYADHMPFNFSDPLVLGTFNGIDNVFRDRGEYSRQVKKTHPHVLFWARYDEDPYDGFAMTGAHFWYIASLWRAQFDMKWAEEQVRRNTVHVDSPASFEYLKNLLAGEGVQVSQIGIQEGTSINFDDARFALILEAVENRVNQTLEVLSGHIGGGHSLYEQFHEEDGSPQGTPDLNWSNLTFAEAVAERDAFVKEIHRGRPELRTAEEALSSEDLRKQIFYGNELTPAVKEALQQLIPEAVWEHLAAEGISKDDIGWEFGPVRIFPAKGNYVLKALRSPHVPEDTVLVALTVLIPGSFDTFENSLVYIPLQDAGEGNLAVLRPGKLDTKTVKYKSHPFTSWTRDHLDVFSRALGFHTQWLLPYDISAATLDELGYEQKGPYARRAVPPQDSRRPELRDDSGFQNFTIPHQRMAFNLKDVGAVIRDGRLSYEDSWRKAKELLPVWRDQHFGHVYPYGGLYEMGEVGLEVHRGRHGYPEDHEPEFIIERGGKVVVMVQKYPTKKTVYKTDAEGTGGAGTLEVEDGHNPFSIYSMLRLNPELSRQGVRPGSSEETKRLMKEFIDEAHRLGIKVTLDFFPWLAPDAIDETNYKLTFFREISGAENEDFRSRDEAGKIEFMKDLVRRNDKFFARRIQEPGKPERVILVNHLQSDLGGTNVDQAVLNPFLPEVQEYLYQSMRQLIDAGADEVRADLAHVLLREYIMKPELGYFSPDYARSYEMNTGQRAAADTEKIAEPWRALIDRVNAYAAEKEHKIEFKLETYDEKYRKRLSELGTQRQYYPDVFENLIAVAKGAPAHFLRGAVVHLLGNRGRLVVYPSNFDQFPMIHMGGPQNAMTALMLVLSYLGADTMWDFRDWMRMSGHVFPMVGGKLDPKNPHHHAFAGQKDFMTLVNREKFRTAAKAAPAAGILKELLQGIGTKKETYIEVSELKQSERFITIAWRNEKEEWIIFAADFRPGQGGFLEEVDVPREALMEMIRDKNKGFFEAFDGAGNPLEIDWQNNGSIKNLLIDPERQYALFKLRRSELRRADLPEDLLQTPETAAGIDTEHLLEAAASAFPGAAAAVLQERYARSELRLDIRVETNAFWGAGDAEKAADRVNRQPLPAQRIEAHLALMRKQIDAMPAGSSRELAEKVFGHLNDIASGKTPVQLLAFDELRWSDGSYFFGRVHRKAIELARGFLDDEELGAQVLFSAAAKHLRLADTAAFSAQENLDDLRQEVFGKDGKTRIGAVYTAFRTLSAQIFLDSALARFHDFDEGSPYFETRSLMADWLRYDLDWARPQERRPISEGLTGQKHPAVEQAGFLASRIWDSRADLLDMSGRLERLKGEMKGNLPAHIRAENEKDIRALTEKIHSYYKVLYPLLTFSVYRHQFFKGMESVVEMLYQDYQRVVKRVQEETTTLMTEQGVDMRGFQRIPEESLQRRFDEMLFHKKIDTNPTEATSLSAAVTGSVSADAFRQAFHLDVEDFMRAVHAPTEWRKTRLEKYASRRSEQAFIEGLGYVMQERIEGVLGAFSNYRPGLDLIVHANNVLPDDIFGFVSAIESERTEEDTKVTSVVADGVGIGYMASAFRHPYYHINTTSGELTVLRYAYTVWADLVEYLQPDAETGFLTAKDPDTVKAIRALVQAGARLNPSSSTGYFEPGVDLPVWTRRLLELSTQNDLPLWKTIYRVYGGKYTDYLTLSRSESGRDQARLFWHYVLFTHPESPLGTLAGKLEYQQGASRKLTKEAARALIDTVIVLLWTGNHRLERDEGLRFLLGKFLSYIHIHPDGIAVPDLAEFKKFLTVFRARSEEEMPALSEWTQEFASFFPEFRHDENTDIFQDYAKDLIPDERFAYIRSGANPLFIPEPFPAAELMHPARHPRSEEEDREVFWVGTYTEEGLRIPGTAFAYKIPGIEPGVRLEVVIDGKQFRIVRHRAELRAVRDLPEEELLVNIPLTEALAERGTHGSKFNQSWEKRPVIAQLNVKTIPEAGGLDSEGYYSVQAGMEGLVKFLHKGNAVSLKARGISDGELLVVQKYGREILFYRSGSGILVGRISVDDEGRVFQDDPNGIELLPKLAPAVSHLEPAVPSDFWKLNALAARLKDLMDQGRGYQRLNLIDSDALTLSQEKDAWVVNVPRKMISSLDEVRGQLKTALENQDPVILAERAVSKLEKLWDSEDAFEETGPVPEIPEKMDSGAQDVWTQQGRETYKKMTGSLELLVQKLKVLRRINDYRRKNRKEIGPKMGGEGSAKLLIRRALDSYFKNPDSEFFLKTRDGSTFTDMKSVLRQRNSYEGAGIVTSAGYAHRLDPAIEEDRKDYFYLTPTSLPPVEPVFFIRYNREVLMRTQGKVEKMPLPVLILFDLETGEVLREEEHRLQVKRVELEELKEKLLQDAEGQVRLAYEIGKNAAAPAITRYISALRAELEHFLSGFGGERAVDNLQTQIDVLAGLRQFLPYTLNSKQYAEEINIAVLRMILADILRAGPESAPERTDRLAHLLRNNPERILGALEFFSMFHEDFDLGFDQLEEIEKLRTEDPARTRFFEVFQEFIDVTFIAALRNPAWEPAWTEEDFFSAVIDEAHNGKIQLEELLKAHPGAVSEDGNRWTNKTLAENHNLLKQEDGTLTPVQRFFWNRWNEKRREAEREALQRERAARSRQEEKDKKISDAEALERGTHITAYGGARIGASAALVEYRGLGQTETDAVLVDAGVQIDQFNTPPRLPNSLSHLRTTPKAVFLTHAHLDHVGYVVPLWRDVLEKKIPVYATRETMDILPLVLRIMARKYEQTPRAEREKARSFFTLRDAEEFIKHVQMLETGKWYRVSEKMKVYYHGPAGHLHGAASLVVSTPDSNTFLMGDVSVHDQGPTQGFAPLPEAIAAQIDQALSESTYGMVDRGPEEEQERALVNAASRTLQNWGARVLFPAFANGRSQRILLLLLKNFERLQSAAGGSLKIYIDGQAADFTELYLRAYPEVFKPYQQIIEDHVILITDSSRRRGHYRSEALDRDANEKTIIISAAGNASEGRSLFWATRLVTDQNSAIYFTGYMDPQERGSRLLAAARDGKTHFDFKEDVRSEEVQRRIDALKKYQKIDETADIEGLIEPLREVLKLGSLPLQATVQEFKLSGHAAGHEIMRQILETFPDLSKVLLGHGNDGRRKEIEQWIKANHPQWNPELLQIDQRRRGAVKRTQTELAGKAVFFNGLAAEELPVPEAGPEIAPAPGSETMTEELATEPAGAEDVSATAEAAKETVEPDGLEEIPAALPAMEVVRGKLTKPSRLALLKRRLQEKADLTAPQARVWLMQIAAEQGKGKAAAEFSESTLEKDLRDIRRGRNELRSDPPEKDKPVAVFVGGYPARLYEEIKDRTSRALRITGPSISVDLSEPFGVQGIEILPVEELLGQLESVTGRVVVLYDQMHPFEAVPLITRLQDEGFDARPFAYPGNLLRAPVWDDSVRRNIEPLLDLVFPRDEEDPARQELREMTAPLLTALASGREELILSAKPSLESIAAALTAYGRQRVFETLREESQNPRYLRIYAQAPDSDEPLLALLETENLFYSQHPSYETDFQAFVPRLSEGVEADLADLINSGNARRLDITFAYRLPQIKDVRDHLLRHLQKIHELQRRHPGRVHSDVRILVTQEERQDPALEEFFKELGRTGTAKPVVFDRPEGIFELRRFLERSGKALVYGLNDIELEGFENRFVHSELKSAQLYPVVLLFSRRLAEEPRDRISAELLREVAEDVDFARFNGTSLEVSSQLVLELMYRYQVSELIASMA